jgi:hypothetical protein
MATLWILALLLAVVTVGFFMRWVPRNRHAPPQTEIPMWDAEDHRQRDFWPELMGRQGPTTRPGELMPDEWSKLRSMPEDDTFGDAEGR